MKAVRVPDTLPEGEVLWRHEAGPPWTDCEAVKEYLRLHGIDPCQVSAIEFYREGNLDRLRVELFAVALPPGYQHEEE